MWSRPRRSLLGSEDLGSAAILLCDLRKILSLSGPPEDGQQPQVESSLQMIFVVGELLDGIECDSSLTQ